MSNAKAPRNENSNRKGKRVDDGFGDDGERDFSDVDLIGDGEADDEADDKRKYDDGGDDPDRDAEDTEEDEMEVEELMEGRRRRRGKQKMECESFRNTMANRLSTLSQDASDDSMKEDRPVSRICI